MAEPFLHNFIESLLSQHDSGGPTWLDTYTYSIYDLWSTYMWNEGHVLRLTVGTINIYRDELYGDIAAILNRDTFTYG
ncbi:hypothetical protein M5K25_013475 [Dendrobium thyrsiflorum]|uniref:Uncharacterized protein n=1 Tax=Dendrobium thyrsiflorum TaxID=117978 RepID=A0ABD0UT94_DENTH